MTASATSRASSHVSTGASRASFIAWLVGVLVAAYGLLLAAVTGLDWIRLQPPGSPLGPPSAVQGLVLKITEGISLALFGAILAAGVFLMERIDGGPRREGETVPSALGRSYLPLAAAAFLVAATIIGSLAPPQRTVSFAPSDFQLRAYPGDGPYETYFVSRVFEASKGEALFARLSVTYPFEGSQDSAFALGILSSISVFLGVFAIFLVINYFTLAQDAFMTGLLPGRLAYVFPVIVAFFLLTARDSRVVRYALVGLWLSTVAIVMYASLRLVAGKGDALGVYLELTIAPLASLALTLLKLKALLIPHRTGLS